MPDMMQKQDQSKNGLKPKGVDRKLYLNNDVGNCLLAPNNVVEHEDLYTPVQCKYVRPPHL
jgi:hypothetical protein